MAPKPKGEAPTRSNRFRMVVIDSDLSDSAIANLTQAINVALRPQLPPAPQGRSALPPITPASGNVEISGGGEADIIEHENDQPVDEPAAAAPPPRVSRTPRQYAKPKVLNIDLTNGRTVPFVSFAKEKGQTADTKRYLMIAAWYHDYAQIPSITADHVYTCYRAMGWTLEASNPNQPFFDIQRQGWGTYKAKKFEINHIGISQVQKMKAGE
jgi:hypothetical protein